VLLTQLLFSEDLLMKFLKLLCLVALVGVMSATAVKADSVPPDPKLLISKPGDPTCPPAPGAGYTCFGDNSAADPLFVADLNTPVEFVYDGTTPLEDLFVSFLKGPLGTIYSCDSIDIFTTATCMPASVADHNGQETLGFEFFGSVTDSLPACAVGGNCSGITAVLEGPEPNSMLLLVSMGLPAIGFARKRWNVRQSA
jgi:hypothetical protein